MTFSKFYGPSEHLTTDEGIVLYKERVIFQYIPTKHKCCGIKIYKLCDETGYKYDLTLYVGKDRQRTAQHLTANHVTVSGQGKYKDMAMKHCQTLQEGDATGLRAPENDTQTW